MDFYFKYCKCFEWNCFCNYVVSLISALIFCPSSWSQLPPSPQLASTHLHDLHQHLKSTFISHVHLSPHYFSNLCDRLRSMGQYEDRWCLVLGGGSTGNRWGLLASSGRVWKWMLACAGGNGSGRSCVMEVGGGGGRWRQWSLLEANGRYWWKSVAGEGSWGYL